MTSTTHQGDILTQERLRRALTGVRRRWRATLLQALAAPAALGVLVLLLEGHGVSWLGGLVAGASATAGLVATRAPRAETAPAPLDDGDRRTRAQLARLQDEGWRGVHDFEGRFAHYQHVAIGGGGIVYLQSERLAHPFNPEDSASQRERLLLRRRALTVAANLRDEIHEATGVPGWVSTVIVVWSDFPAGSVQDGRCVFVSGSRLVDWLRRRPGQLSPERAGDVVAALRGLGGHAE